MPTARLVASAYSVSDSSISVSSASNMYTDTDSTTYATISTSNKNTTEYFVYLKGFNIGSIPSNASLSSFSVLLKGYESSLSTGAAYAPRVCNGTTVLSGTTADDSFHSSSNTLTIPTGSLTWANLVNYGSDLAIRISLRRSNKNSSGKAYVQGAEISVTYTVPSDDPPVITVGTPSVSRISAITDHDQCVCTFTSNLALQQWEARATKAGVTPARGVGLLVESGGALAANTPATVYVENEELTQGDGEYTITVYGLSTGGIWSE